MERRSFIAGAAAVGMSFATPACAQVGARRFTPEEFGARGDGTSNDTRAFGRLAAAVNAAGGGIVDLQKKTYLVGEQRPVLRRNSAYSFEPVPLLDFIGCSAAVLIRGNGATIKCAPGLRYGTFDPFSARPTRNKLPFTGSQMATPYAYMIKVERCTGPVEISDLELDGSVENLILGGEYGDSGRQIAAYGIALYNNRGSEVIRNVYSHHHALDGLLIDGWDALLKVLPERRIIGLRSEYNGRQGCSIVGGRGYVFEDCKFNHTGRSKVATAPGAGVDIEAEGGKRNRDLTFVRCQFADNDGCALLADSGDTAGARFSDCTFIGTTAWAAWPKKPLFKFDDCLFVGAICNTYGSSDPGQAAQFRGCEFRDDPKLSPTGKVYASGPIADVSSYENVLFSRCWFALTHAAVLPWSLNAIYADCRMEQRSPEIAYPRGIYRGRNMIRGNVALENSKNVGELIVNGRRQ